VVIDPATLRTLPAAHLKAGLAEAIKHAVIADAELFHWIATHLTALIQDPGGPAMTELIARAVSIKARVVESDERESALRKTLNFGHTIGHAIERVSRYGVPHGEAVAIGMVAEARAAEATGIADPGTAEGIAVILADAGLPVRLPAGMEPSEVLAATSGDKKSRLGSVEYALPERIGVMAGETTGYAMRVADETVLRALAETPR
jgi:3-dehydroquinate synthase